ncbi:hypothetical protein ABC502_08565 [Alkalimonas sp. NCh-2]|uniref:hypothetical protein n=1 Tax=Alkalimonas sp. NCh-2 TaxID=3144846 RepID=UPI0031F694D0
MDTLPKLKKLPTPWLYVVLYRTFLGAALAYYLADMVGRPMLQQLLFFALLAVVTVVIEQWPRGAFKPYAAKVQQGTISLLGVEFKLADTEYMHYEVSQRSCHRVSIKQAGYLPVVLQVTQADFLENNRLLHFLQQHYPALQVVDELSR